MAVTIKTFGPIEIWGQSYGPEVCKILVAHCELVHKKDVLQGNMTVFKYRLSDRGEILLALTNQKFLAGLHRREAEDSEYFWKE